MAYAIVQMLKANSVYNEQDNCHTKNLIFDLQFKG